MFTMETNGSLPNGQPSRALRSVGYFVAPTGEVSAFGVGARERESGFVGGGGLGPTPEPSEEVRSGGGEEVVVVECPLLFECVEQSEANLGTVSHRDRDGPVEGDHR